MIMKLYFKCTLLSDIVLTSRSASEGFHESLTYIPGGKFLGIVASKLYAASSQQQALDLFHNGVVRFGNAQIAINHQPSYATPFAWFTDKLKEDKKVYLHHKISDTIRTNLLKTGLQLKQERFGYIDANAACIAKMKQGFSIKSAYASDKRKSLDENMYGYHALKAGSDFLFTVELPEKSNYESLITEALTGKKRVGRSRTAEYGLVNIQRCEQSFKELKHEVVEGNSVLVYADSDLCFFDKFGFPTTEITAKDLGLEEGEIDWGKSQIRYRKYQSYNSHRLQTNEDRMVFEKGSVIAVKVEDSGKYQNIPDWVGSLNNEGFGRIICNPPFLNSSIESIAPPEEYKLEKVQKKFIVSSGGLDNQVLNLVSQREGFIDKDAKIEEEVKTFFGDNKDNFNGISKSQWGAVRGIAKSTANRKNFLELLFHQDVNDEKRSKGFLRRGVAAKNWNGKADLLENFATAAEESQSVIIKLASKMQKYIDSKNKGKNAK
jgi:hypothetical protein